MCVIVSKTYLAIPTGFLAMPLRAKNMDIKIGSWTTVGITFLKTKEIRAKTDNR